MLAVVASKPVKCVDGMESDTVLKVQGGIASRGGRSLLELEGSSGQPDKSKSERNSIIPLVVNYFGHVVCALARGDVEQNSPGYKCTTWLVGLTGVRQRGCRRLSE